MRKIDLPFPPSAFAGGLRILLLSLLLVAFALACGERSHAQELKRIAIKIPPPGVKVDAAKLAALRKRLEKLQGRVRGLDNEFQPDIEVLTKAVQLAIRHNEFYKKGDVGKAEQLLTLAEQRLQRLQAGSPDWPSQRGLVVRGYRSRIDNSVQPYGLHIPSKAQLSLEKKTPLIVWLHGRGDKVTDLHFIHQRLNSTGNVHPDFAITVHPFGRHCMGFKSAGEIDVLDVVEEVKRNYPIDPDRILLMGFSMGGAGAWHVGAHYADQWAAVAPGAGFAETARYTRLAVDKYPAWYEQKLWGVYDVPGYVRNLFQPTVVAYSGEKDKQIQAARVMEEAFLSQGRMLTHLIGPGMGHKYHPETLRDLLQRMQAAAEKGRDLERNAVHLQTRTLRYSKQHWVQALRLEQHWRDSRIDAEADGETLRITTKNVRALRLTPPRSASLRNIQIDQQSLPRTGDSQPITLVKKGQKWSIGDPNKADSKANALAKRPGLQGPIDDAFLEPFLVVTPSGKHQHERVERWVRFELDHLVRRWSTLYRADVLIKQDREVSDDDIASRHLVLFGDPASNSVLRRVLAAENRPPLRWDAKRVELDDGRRFDAATHVPVLVYPNPLNPQRYIVINSGPTHREGHDRTNSLQNPKLPDWAILDLSQPPNDVAAGRVVDANFFAESWELREQNSR